MEKAKVKAFQVTEDHFRGATPVPEWMEGRARLLDFDGISGKIEIETRIVLAGPTWRMVRVS